MCHHVAPQLCLWFTGLSYLSVNFYQPLVLGLLPPTYSLSIQIPKGQQFRAEVTFHRVASKLYMLMQHL